MIPYSRPKLSDFHTSSYQKTAKKTLDFTVAHTYIAYVWDVWGLWCTWEVRRALKKLACFRLSSRGGRKKRTRKKSPTIRESGTGCKEVGVAQLLRLFRDLQTSLLHRNSMVHVIPNQL